MSVSTTKSLKSQAYSLMTSIVFIGNEQLSSTREKPSLAIFKMLLANEDYAIEALIIKDSSQKSRKPRRHPIVELAEANQIPILRVAGKSDLLEATSDLKSKLAVLVAFGMIIPQSVIDRFPTGLLNIHPSLLPLYRGTTPIESAILDGAKETGVSLIQLSSQMDAGPLYGQLKLVISTSPSKSELTRDLNLLAADLLESALPHIVDGSLQPTVQNDEDATYTPMLDRSLSRIDLSKPALRLEREVSAYMDWPGSKITFGGEELTITSAHEVPATDTDIAGTIEAIPDTDVLAAYTPDGWLCIDRVKPNGKKDMPTSEYLRGLRQP